MRLAALLLVPAMAGGCGSGPAPWGGREADALRPPGIAEGRAAVDPVIVGDRLLAAGEAELALDSYVRAAAGPAGPTPRIRHAMARADIALGRLRQARALLREVVELEPRNAAARNDLGVVLLELGETGEAHVLFRSAYALQPLPEIRDNLRLSGDRLAATVGGAPTGGVPKSAIVLTPRSDGTYGLSAPPGEP